MGERKKPFAGLKVYYAGSMRGVPEANPDFPYELVHFMMERGADVLSEHVIGRTAKETDVILVRRMGDRASEIVDHPTPWFGARRIDLEWLGQADCLVALVNGASHGVGMEIERALIKSQLSLDYSSVLSRFIIWLCNKFLKCSLMGLNQTPVLCLVHEDSLDGLSYMVRGVSEKGFHLKTYTDLDSAKLLIHDFLMGLVT